MIINHNKYHMCMAFGFAAQTPVRTPQDEDAPIMLLLRVIAIIYIYIYTYTYIYIYIYSVVMYIYVYMHTMYRERYIDGDRYTYFPPKREPPIRRRDPRLGGSQRSHRASEASPKEIVNFICLNWEPFVCECIVCIVTVSYHCFCVFCCLEHETRNAERAWGHRRRGRMERGIQTPCPTRSGAVSHPIGVYEQTFLLHEPLPCGAAAETAVQPLIWCFCH